MNICYVVDELPFPLYSGRLRQFHFLRQLSLKHSITLISFPQENPMPESIDEIKKFVPDLHIFPRTKTTDASGHIKPKQTNSKERFVGSCLLELLSRREYDLVFLAWRKVLECLPQINIPLVVDFCDADWAKMLQRIRYEGLGNAIRTAYSAFRTLQSEIRYANAVNLVLFAAQRDAKKLMWSCKTPFAVVPNGIDTQFWKREAATLGKNHILFAGSMSYFPNVDAAIYLIDQVFPKIRKQCPEVELSVVGRNPPPRLLKRSKNNVVNVVGFVPDMRPYYENASLFIAPLRIAGGIQNKILEAMAMAMPVITSPAAVSGIFPDTNDIDSGLQIRICNTANVMANEAAILLKRNIDLPINANRAYVENEFSWQIAASLLERALMEYL